MQKVRLHYKKAATERFPGSTYQEQAMLDLIYANYKTQDYTATLVTVDNYLQQFPQSPNRDYAVYMAGLTNLATADNMIQDFFTYLNRIHNLRWNNVFKVSNATTWTCFMNFFH